MIELERERNALLVKVAELERERDELRKQVARCERYGLGGAPELRDVEFCRKDGARRVWEMREKLTTDRDAAQATAAMLREALRRAASWGLNAPMSSAVQGIQDEYRADIATVRAALSTPGSDWLAKHDARVRTSTRDDVIATDVIRDGDRHRR